MAKQIMQFRYYGEEKNNKPNDKNQPKGLVSSQLSRGTAFANYLPITQLGIQTLPGTEFYLNNSVTPVLVGSTGIYELDLEGLSAITALHFDKASLSAISKNPNAYLIIDIIYDSKEG